MRNSNSCCTCSYAKSVCDPEIAGCEMLKSLLRFELLTKFCICCSTLISTFEQKISFHYNFHVFISLIAIVKIKQAKLWPERVTGSLQQDIRIILILLWFQFNYVKPYYHCNILCQMKHKLHVIFCNADHWLSSYYIWLCYMVHVIDLWQGQ